MNMFEVCKLHQKQFRILFSEEQRILLDNIPVLKGHEWDGKLDYSVWPWGARTNIEEIKTYIKVSLEEAQEKYCAYCGGELNVTSLETIDHIAPKGKDRYPQFMFNVSNLVLACSLCNGFEKKERQDSFNTIEILKDDYEECIFNIVHPYLDDPSVHFELGIEGRGITISPKTFKGENSINIFNLDDEPQTNSRGKAFMSNLYDFDPNFKEAFHQACLRQN